MEHQAKVPYSTRENHYATHLDAEQLLKTTCACLGITGYRMAFLLGTTVANYQRWFTGKYRPSQKYMVRAGWIQVFKANGLPIGLVQRIDWHRREVVYARGITIGERIGEDGQWRDPLTKFEAVRDVETVPVEAA